MFCCGFPPQILARVFVCPQYQGDLSPTYKGSDQLLLRPTARWERGSPRGSQGDAALPSHSPTRRCPDGKGLPFGGGLRLIRRLRTLASPGAHRTSPLAPAGSPPAERPRSSGTREHSIHAVPACAPARARQWQEGVPTVGTPQPQLPPPCPRPGRCAGGLGHARAMTPRCVR